MSYARSHNLNHCLKKKILGFTMELFLSTRELLLEIIGTLILICVAGILVVDNPIYRVTFLCFVFILASAIFLLLDFYFLSLTYIIVYVGAIAILFIFTVMMINTGASYKE